MVRGFVLPAALLAFAAPSFAQPPNIVHLLIDDLGYADLGCYGGPLAETPNLDRFAAQGVRFTSAYCPSPICSPSRAAFLTGRSPARLHFETVTTNADRYLDWGDALNEQYKQYPLVPPPHTLDLPLAERTVAEVLADAGYVTGMTGKWHIAAHRDNEYLAWSTTHGPARQGFQWTGETFGAHPYGYRHTRGLNKYQPHDLGEFPADELTRQAIAFIRQPRDRPFFLYLPHYYVHDPIDVPAKWAVDKYRAKAPPGTSEKRIKYAAFIEQMDHYVGQFLDALDEAGLSESTLVVITSDNGGHPEFAWNRPLRGSKWNLYEGGTRVPLLVRWPGRIEPGTTCDVPVIGMDFLPTYQQLAGARQDEGVALDGRSILPLLLGESDAALTGRTLTWHFPYYHSRPKTNPANPIGIEDEYISLTRPMSSIRRGDDKLVYFHEDGRVELYDLSRDIAEQHDRSAAEPALAAELRDALLRELKAANARFPRKNPLFEPAAEADAAR